MTCAGGLAYCAGLCVSLMANPMHCGACGNACGANKPCVNGMCL